MAEQEAAAQMAVALVFPGQGSQSVGMLAALAARFPLIGQCFAQASETLGLDLWQLTSAGPAELLNMTELTQPVMLTAGVATWRVWRAQGGQAPAIVSGHSLGEFTALVCAEALPFDAAVRLVQERGQIMQRAVHAGEGAMAAILGLEDRQVEAVCAEAAQGLVVEAVNYNAPSQVVIAGHTMAVERAMQLASERGAKRTVRLPVSVPAHSSLLRAASLEFGQSLARVPLSRPRYRYISAVDAREHAEPEEIRSTLVRQLASPVRWTDTVRALAAAAPTLIECGPGKVLTGLNRRIERNAHCLALEDPDSLTAALAATGAALA
jgi:[acyl-carrier-protein] S-malonyltransferase